MVLISRVRAVGLCRSVRGADVGRTGAAVLGLAAATGCGNEVTIIGAGGNGGSSGNGQQSTPTGKVRRARVSAARP